MLETYKLKLTGKDIDSRLDDALQNKQTLQEWHELPENVTDLQSKTSSLRTDVTALQDIANDSYRKSETYTKGEVDTKVKIVQDAVNTLNDADTVDGSIAHTLKSYATNAALETQISQVNSAINTNWSAAKGMIYELQHGTIPQEIEQTVANKIANIVSSAPDDFDSLKEVADWIKNDTTGAAKMQTDIATLNTTISAEKTAREKAITDETTRATAAEKTNSDAITAEQAARDNADKTLQANIDKKQNTLTAGDNITIENNTISAKIYNDKEVRDSIATNTADIATLKGDKNTVGSVAKQIADAKSELNTSIATKQNTLTAGANIQIADNGTISATDTIYDDTQVKADIATLKGDTTVDGSVAKQIADAKSELNKSIEGKSNINHTHTWDSITDKPTAFAPSNHKHSWNTDIIDKPSIPTTVAELTDASSYALVNNVYSKNDIDSKLYSYATITHVTSELTKKQDKLTLGKGLGFDTDGKLNVTLDTTLYKIVSELPDNGPEENDKNKLFLVKSSTTGTRNKFKEFIWETSDEGSDWEQLGEVQIKINLTDYATITYVTSELSKKQNSGNYLTEVPDTYATKEFVDTELTSYASKSDLSSYATKEFVDTELTSYALKTDITNAITEALADVSGEGNNTKPAGVITQKITEKIATKQDTLSAGVGINIEKNVISVVAPLHFGTKDDLDKLANKSQTDLYIATDTNNIYRYDGTNLVQLNVVTSQGTKSEGTTETSGSEQTPVEGK